MSDRAISILIALVVLAALGTLGVHYYLGNEAAPQQVPTAPRQTTTPKTAVDVRVTRCERHNARTESSGYIENVGNVDLHFVTINVIWKNSSGLVIETDSTYALNNGKLSPGDRKAFRAFTNLPAARCNAEALDWW